jgi:hypothetical protein
MWMRRLNWRIGRWSLPLLAIATSGVAVAVTFAAITFSPGHYGKYTGPSLPSSFPWTVYDNGSFNLTAKGQYYVVNFSATTSFYLGVLKQNVSGNSTYSSGSDWIVMYVMDPTQFANFSSNANISSLENSNEPGGVSNFSVQFNPGKYFVVWLDTQPVWESSNFSIQVTYRV